MKYVVFCLFLIGCDFNEQEKHRITTEGKALVECPTADVTLTSPIQPCSWECARTITITGCGLKVCCYVGHSDLNCFPCKKDEWYGK